MKLIDTPYGKKSPELLCRAMDALELQSDLLAALEQALNNPPTGVDYLLWEDKARAAIAKATRGEA